MTLFGVRRWAVIMFGCTLPHAFVAAQTTVAAGDARPIDTRAADAALDRPVSIRLSAPSVRAAVDAVAKVAGVRVFYESRIFAPYTTPIPVNASATPLRTVLATILSGTHLHVVPVANGAVSIQEGDVDSVHTGTISGVITDAKSKRALRGVSVTLDDKASVIRTDDDGRYHFANVAVGAHHVVVRFIGYGRQTKAITLHDDETATADFALETSSANTLDQVVITATGNQRVRELGHVVAQINADSLVKEAPITSLSELLSARVPGLQVMPGNGGVVGGDVALRLRGQTTIYADPQPIVIVDGVRYKNTNTIDGEFGGLSEDQRPFGIEPRSPLNDLNVNDIDKIEVVKGPSASTLYGPDASNGVILITTKRGHVGKPQWHVYAYPDLSVVPKPAADISRGYRIWGHDPTTNLTVPFNCLLVEQVGNPPQCVFDSVTVTRTAIATPAYSVVAKSRPQWFSGASVSGGTAGLTYYFSGNVDWQTGALQLSPFAANFLRQQLGTATLKDVTQNPNTQRTIGGRAAITSQLTPWSSLNFAIGYTQPTQRGINVQSVYDATTQIGVLPLGVDTNTTALGNYLPTNAFLETSEQHASHWSASVGGSIQATSWLSGTADLGLDLGNSSDYGVVPKGAEGAGSDGRVSDFRRETTERTANLRLTATRTGSLWSFRTSVGTQYTYSKLDGLNTTGTGLAPGSTSISTATSVSAGQLWSEVVTLGGYGEETIGLRDRLFLTGSLRVDGSTTFGDAYHPRPFPKIGLSWVASEEPFMRWLQVAQVTDLHLRSSYGVASRYPNSAEKYGYITARQTGIDGQPTNVFDRQLLANPLIRPERTGEAEYGADFNIASNVRFELTWFNRRTTDQLSLIPAPSGYLPSWGNIGNVAAHGFEATMNTALFTTSTTKLDLLATFAQHTDKLVSRGSAKEVKNWFGSLVAGYPLDASFGQTVVSIADTAHGGPDGIIESQEVTLSPLRFLGVLIPPKVLTVTPRLSLLGGYVRLSTMFVRQSGGMQLDRFGFGCTGTALCLAPFLKSTPLAQQARFVSGNPGDFIVSSDMTRWQEFSLTMEVPQRFREKVWLSRASMTLQVRDLALWTKYKGVDPESAPGLGTVGLASAQNSGFGIPQPRSWGIRFDITP